MNISKKIIALSGIASLLLGSAPLLASSQGRPTWSLPDTAVEVAPNVFYLGQKFDKTADRLVDGYSFVHQRGAISNKARKSGTTSCYSYIGRGAKWKVVEPWVMNTANTRGLNGATVFALEAGGIDKWEDATDGVVGNSAGANIMGTGSTTTADLSVDAGTLNDVNEVYFADISGSTSTIGVTTVWGIFSGPASGREIVEWDQVYDDVDFDWSTTGVAGKMDFENIAVHEIGHAVGMGHSGSTCALETMYAYASEGETIKRDLNTGDINGVNALY